MTIRATNLFANLAADGNTAAFVCPGNVNKVRVYLPDAASDGGGTLKMQSSMDGGTTWVDVPSASWTSGDNYLGEFTVCGQSIRFNLASSTSPTNMDIQVDVTAVSMSDFAAFTGITDNTATLGATNYEFLLSHQPATLCVHASGTFDSGVVKVQQSPDGGTTWYDVNFTGVSAAGHEYADALGAGPLFRAEVVSVAGAGAALNVTVLAA